MRSCQGPTYEPATDGKKERDKGVDKKSDEEGDDHVKDKEEDDEDERSCDDVQKVADELESDDSDETVRSDVCPAAASSSPPQPVPAELNRFICKGGPVRETGRPTKMIISLLPVCSWDVESIIANS